MAQTPTMNAAVLLAYAYVDDRSVVPVLQEVLKHDTDTLAFFQECAFKLEQAQYLAYIIHGTQRIITRKGRDAARQIKSVMMQQHGELSDMELIHRLADGCIKELGEWAPVGTQAQWNQMERVAAQLEK